MATGSLSWAIQQLWRPHSDPHSIQCYLVHLDYLADNSFDRDCVRDCFQRLRYFQYLRPGHSYRLPSLSQCLLQCLPPVHLQYLSHTCTQVAMEVYLPGRPMAFVSDGCSERCPQSSEALAASVLSLYLTLHFYLSSLSLCFDRESPPLLAYWADSQAICQLPYSYRNCSY